MSGAHPISYDAEDDPFQVVEMAVATFETPSDRMGFMKWAVECLRSVDPRRMNDCTFRFNLTQGVVDFLDRDQVLRKFYPKGWQ